MELINNEYVEVNRFDVFKMQIVANNNNNELLETLSSQVISSMFDYEREARPLTSVIDFYVSVNSPFYLEASKITSVPVKWESVLNACVYATYNKDFNVAYRLSVLLTKKEIFPEDLGDLLDYVLENSIDMREHANGEQERLIYDDETNVIEKGFIYQPKGKKLEMNKNKKDCN